MNGDDAGCETNGNGRILVKGDAWNGLASK